MALLLVVLILLAMVTLYLFGPVMLGLYLGVPAFGLVVLACGGDNHDVAVAVIFATVCWFAWAFRKALR